MTYNGDPDYKSIISKAFKPVNITDDAEKMKSDTTEDLETMLAEDLGQLGPYQLRVMAALLIMSAVSAIGSTEYLFTTARIPTRCLIKECETPDSIEFSPLWISDAIPTTNSGFDNCRRFINNSAISSNITYESCPATLFNRNVTKNCEQYVYENTNTVVYDFELACDEWRRTVIGSVQTLGAFVALPLTGFVSDRWGRRIALSFNAFNMAWIGLTRYWANSYYAFLVFDFFKAFLGSGAFSCIYILVMELFGPKYRVTAGATISSFFSIGQIVVALVAWVIPNWRLLTLALYAPQLLAISYYWIVPESIRWYQAKSKHEKAEAALKKIARINHKELSDRSLQALRTPKETEVNKTEENGEWLIVKVFKNKPILKRCLISPFWWITTTFVYYGLSINAVNIISGNIYLNYMAVAAVEAPGFWTAVLLIGRVGRKPVLTGAYWICAVCQLAYIFISQDLPFAVSLTVYLIGKFCIAIVTTAMYVYTAELYPTECRHSLFAFSSMLGRIGSILAPLTPALGASTWDWLPFALFGIMALVAGALVLLTPETLGRPMPDTMQEAVLLSEPVKRNI